MASEDHHSATPQPLAVFGLAENDWSQPVPSWMVPAFYAVAESALVTLIAARSV